jgi:8-oxo-dGTP diphosphatase
MGITLALISVFLSIILYPIAIVISIFKKFWKKKFKLAFKNFDKQMLAIATSIDASGNVVCKDLFNLTLINKKGYKFGNRKETISSVLGKNQRDNTLRKAGIILSKLLDLIDPNHCINSIDDSI